MSPFSRINKAPITFWNVNFRYIWENLQRLDFEFCLGQHHNEKIGHNDNNGTEWWFLCFREWPVRERRRRLDSETYHYGGKKGTDSTEQDVVGTSNNGLFLSFRRFFFKLKESIELAIISNLIVGKSWNEKNDNSPMGFSNKSEIEIGLLKHLDFETDTQSMLK